MEALALFEVWEKLFGVTSPRPGGMGVRDGLPPPLPRGERPQIMAAIGGIDIALWDTRESTRACRCGGCWEAKSARFRRTRQGATIVPGRRARATPENSTASRKRGSTAARPRHE